MIRCPEPQAKKHACAYAHVHIQGHPRAWPLVPPRQELDLMVASMHPPMHLPHLLSRQGRSCPLLPGLAACREKPRSVLQHQAPPQPERLLAPRQTGPLFSKGAQQPQPPTPTTSCLLCQITPASSGSDALRQAKERVCTLWWEGSVSDLAHEPPASARTAPGSPAREAAGKTHLPSLRQGSKVPAWHTGAGGKGERMTRAAV